MSNPRNSTRARRICWNTHKTVHAGTGEQVMICGSCRQYIHPVRDHWRADHIVRHAEGGLETAENLRPICLSCDAGPDGKAANDTREVAKGRRTAENHVGVREKRGRPMPGTRASGLRKRVDDTVERR